VFAEVSIVAKVISSVPSWKYNVQVVPDGVFVSSQNWPANWVAGADVPELEVDIADKALLMSDLVAGKPALTIE